MKNEQPPAPPAGVNTLAEQLRRYWEQGEFGKMTREILDDVLSEVDKAETAELWHQKAVEAGQANDHLSRQNERLCVVISERESKIDTVSAMNGKQEGRIAALESLNRVAVRNCDAAKDLATQRQAESMDQMIAHHYYRNELTKAHALVGRLLQQLGEHWDSARITEYFPTDNGDNSKTPLNPSGD